MLSKYPALVVLCFAMTTCAGRGQRGESTGGELGVVDRTAAPADLSSPMADPPDVTSAEVSDIATLDISETDTSGSIDYPRQRIRYALAIARPRTVAIIVEGHGMDPTVALLDESGLRLGFDDDGGDGTNARLRRSLQTGNYVIEVAGFGRSTGTFTVTVR